MTEPLDIDEMRQTLARVSTYHRVRESVRAGSGHSMMGGLFYIGLGFFLYNARGNFTPIVIAFMALGLGELIVGLWKRIAPSPECILMDAILEFAFVVYLAFRVTDGFAQIPQRVDPIFIGISLWAAFNGYQHLQSYLRLRKVFVERPTGDHLAYVADLTDDVADGDPHTDPTVIDLPTKPRMRAKLLGDVAFFYDFQARVLYLCARDEMAIARQVRGGGEPTAVLTIGQQHFPPFALDATSWNNYANWKSAAGEPPLPVTVLPAR